MKSEKGAVKPKKIRKLHRVNSVMWGYFCLLSFILILLVELVFYLVVMNTLQDQAKNKLERIGGSILSIIRENRENGADGNFSAAMGVYFDEGVSVYLLASDGSIIFPEVSGGEMFDEARFSELEDRLGGVGEEIYVPYVWGEHLCSAANVEFSDEVSGYVLISYSLAVLKGTVGNMQVYLIIVGFVVLILALGISYSMTQKLTGGLKVLSDSAVSLAEGDYSVEFTNLDYKELAQLSDALNYVRDEVEKSEDFQHEILANVTHDLKTPLTMIKAYASMIKEISGDNPEKREKHLQVIIDETDRLTGLVDDVLRVSKVSAKIDEINPKVFNLTEFLYGIIAKFGYLQETQGYSFMVDIDANLYTRADEEKIGQVIYNLLGNAANYTGEDKTVYISLKLNMEGDRIKFSVRDTGKGIKKDEIENIWDRYYKVKENHVRPVKSTGLGLNIVKVILKNHEFDFGVESEEGKGSTFWVDFPAVPSQID